MNPFHYNQDPLYSAAASILQGQPAQQHNAVTEDYSIKYPAVRTLMDKFTSLDAVELADTIGNNTTAFNAFVKASK